MAESKTTEIHYTHDPETNAWVPTHKIETTSEYPDSEWGDWGGEDDGDGGGGGDPETPDGDEPPSGGHVLLDPSQGWVKNLQQIFQADQGIVATRLGPVPFNQPVGAHSTEGSPEPVDLSAARQARENEIRAAKRRHPAGGVGNEGARESSRLLNEAFGGDFLGVVLDMTKRLDEADGPEGRIP